MTLNSALYISLGYKTKKIWSTKSVNYNIFTMYYIMDIYWNVRQDEQYAVYANTKMKELWSGTSV